MWKIFIKNKKPPPGPLGRGCKSITKPPYTPPRGTCLFVNFLTRLRVTDNKCMSSLLLMRVFNCWHFHHPYFACLFGTVHCPSRGSWCKLLRCIQTLGMICCHHKP